MAFGWIVRSVATLEDEDLHALAELPIDCVDGGASVSFMHPLSMPSALAFSSGLADTVARGARALRVADDEGGNVIGSVQVVLGQPENQPHRADVAKMLVHRRARRRGLGAALLQSAEAAARASGKNLLVLDTASGSDAERLYVRLDWQRCGVIPGYAERPRGGLCSTTIFYKAL